MGVYECVPDPVCLVSVSLSRSSRVWTSECECAVGLKPTEVLEQMQAAKATLATASLGTEWKPTLGIPLLQGLGTDPWVLNGLLGGNSRRGWAVSGRDAWHLFLHLAWGSSSV